ncbi:MAG: helix-turn-helix transcriptional regulator [Phycisphaeraceae bacterium]|nr:helix-turn-helix transcriptional regulator [Phycisphaeraceae bacterium]
MPATRSMTPLSVLFQHRWTLPVLAELGAASGAKAVTLVNRLGVSRAVLSQTLEHAIDRGWVARNEGYGHPLRPEYLPTAEVGRLLRPAVAYLAAAEAQGCEEVALRKWSASVLVALDRREGRFSVIREAIPGISDRALALALRDLEGAGLVARRVVDDRPPRAEYEITPSGRGLRTAGAALARALKP